MVHLSNGNYMTPLGTSNTEFVDFETIRSKTTQLHRLKSKSNHYLASYV